MLDLLAAFAVSVGKFYDRKHDEAAGRRDTMVARVSRDYFSKALNRMFALLSAEVFLTPYWLDKTPNSDMIHLAPRFREIWPNAIFIFMKRRAIENLVSRERKFQAYNFTQNCREWADAMNAWLEVKNGLKLCSIEIDQIDLARHPAEIAEQLAKLLALDVNEHSRLEQALTNDRPERTSDEFGAVYDYDQLDWDQTRRQIFNERCGDLMVQFGYSRSSSYFAGT